MEGIEQETCHCDSGDSGDSGRCTSCAGCRLRAGHSKVDEVGESVAGRSSLKAQ